MTITIPVRRMMGFVRAKTGPFVLLVIYNQLPRKYFHHKAYKYANLFTVNSAPQYGDVHDLRGERKCRQS